MTKKWNGTTIIYFQDNRCSVAKQPPYILLYLVAHLKHHSVFLHSLVLPHLHHLVFHMPLQIHSTSFSTLPLALEGWPWRPHLPAPLHPALWWVPLEVSGQKIKGERCQDLQPNKLGHRPPLLPCGPSQWSSPVWVPVTAASLIPSGQGVSISCEDLVYQEPL